MHVVLAGRRLHKWIAERLRLLREKQFNGTAQEFANAAGISLRHVYKTEAGGSSPTIDTLASWLHACNTDLYTFFEPLADIRPSEDERMAELRWKLTAAMDFAKDTGREEAFYESLMMIINGVLATAPKKRTNNPRAPSL